MANTEEGLDSKSSIGWKSFLRTLSPLMVARNGRVVSAHKRTCGQDRSVEVSEHPFSVASKTQAGGINHGWSELVGIVVIR